MFKVGDKVILNPETAAPWRGSMRDKILTVVGLTHTGDGPEYPAIYIEGYLASYDERIFQYAPERATIPRLTKEQAAIIGAFTGIACGPFSDIQEYVQKILERPVWTHEFANKELMTVIKEKAKPDFLALCHVEAKNV